MTRPLKARDSSGTRLVSPIEARWLVSEPQRTLAASDLERIVHRAFGERRILEAEPLAGGFRNTNLKVRLDGESDYIVVRIYRHHASLCRKEIDLFRLVGGSVPVPDLIHAEPLGLENLPPFVVMRYVDGLSFRDLVRSDDRAAIAQAAFSAGKVLAAIGRITFAESGWLVPGPAVTTPLTEGEDPIPEFLDLCLASTNLQSRMPSELCEQLHGFAWSRAPQLHLLDAQTCLVHGDFGKRNLRVRRDCQGWAVAAVLDWEFAVSGSPLADLGHFLRYEVASRPVVEPYFSKGYLHAGGELPPDWRRLTRLLDLAALCESLTHDQLPDAVVSELLELIRATIQDRDPQLP